MTQLLDGRYELLERIGAGGAASVHRAVDRRLGREVAVKLLDDLAASSADPAGRSRFLLEARTAARLQHPHVVTVFDAGEADGRLYLVMQLVEGATLAEVIAQRAPLPTDEAARLTIQILHALDAAHRHDIVHRDVKPANVVIDQGGDAHLTDFGIAWRLGDIEEHLTTVGTVVGTPTYLAPEQATGGELGAATDVYLAGLVLDEMLTGRRTNGEAPSANVAAELAALAGAFDPRDVNPAADERLANVVARATDPDPAQRFASATEMIAAIVGRDPVASPLGAAPVARSVEPTATLAMAGATTAATEVMAAGPGLADRTIALPSASPAGWPEPAPEGERVRGRWWWLAVAAAVLAVFVILAIALGGSDTESPAPINGPTPASTVVETIEPAPSTAAVVDEVDEIEVDEVDVDDGGGGGGNGRGSGNGNGNRNGNGRGRGND